MITTISFLWLMGFLGCLVHFTLEKIKFVRFDEFGWEWFHSAHWLVCSVVLFFIWPAYGLIPKFRLISKM